MNSGHHSWPMDTAQVVSRGLRPKSPWIQLQPNAITTDKPKVLYLPYIQHIAEPIQRVCRQLGVKIVFRTAQTLRQQLVKVKTLRPELLMKNVIYEVPCQDCASVYIGETGRCLHAGETKRTQSSSETL